MSDESGGIAAFFCLGFGLGLQSAEAAGAKKLDAISRKLNVRNSLRIKEGIMAKQE